MTDLLKKIGQFFTLLLCVAGLFGILFYFVHLPEQLKARDNIGKNCIKKELPMVLNDAGMVVSADYALCKDKPDSTVSVYLHKQGELKSEDSLIFRYVANPASAIAQIKWNGNSSLLILVGDILRITKMVKMKFGVTISYVIGKELQEEKQDWSLEEIAALLFFVMILLIMTIYKLIKHYYQ